MNSIGGVSFRLPLPHLRQLTNRCLSLKANRRVLRISSRRLRSQEEAYEGPELQPLDESSQGGLGGTSEEVYGQLAILLVGFRLPEVTSFRQMLVEMGAEDVQLLSCGSDYLEDSLATVFAKSQSNFEDPPLGLRRTVFLSGMYASEVNEVISAFNESQLPPAVFSALVPKNKDKKIAELVDEVYDDHQYMLSKHKNKKTY